MLSLSDFITKYTGVANVGDTPDNKGQCVGLVETYLDDLGSPHVWGHAYQLLDSADKSAYTVIRNNPLNSPAPGDIVVWDNTWGNGYGHCGIAVDADINSFVSFEQNNPIGHAPQLIKHNYLNVQGWLHPNVLPGTTSPEVNNGQIQDQLNAQIEATTNCQTQLKSASEQNKTLQITITHLETDKQDLQEQLKKLQSEYATDEREIIDLNSTIETLSGTNKKYAEQAGSAADLTKDFSDYLTAITDALHVSPNELQSDKDVIEACLAAIENKNKEILSVKEQLLKCENQLAVPVPDIIKRSIAPGFFSGAVKGFFRLFYTSGGKGL